jgi:hypothetical protein
MKIQTHRRNQDRIHDFKKSYKYDEINLIVCMMQLFYERVLFILAWMFNFHYGGSYFFH